MLRIARRTRGEEDLHRLRQQLRRLQLVADLSPKWSRPSDAAARRVDRTIASLGELHDLDVLRQVFRGLPIGSAGRLVVEAIGRRRRKLERKVEVLLRSRRLMRFGRPA